MPPMLSCHGGGGSCILLHTCNTDDSTRTVSTRTVSGHGASALHAAAIFATSDQGLTKCIHDTHRARICQFINFLFKKYGDIYELCTCIISPKAHANLELYYTERDIRDLTYSGLDPINFLAFLTDVKKANVKLSSFFHMSKFKDAVKYSSKISNKRLSVEFYSKIDTFLFSTRRSLKKQKRRQ